ncbi:MAG: MerR family transcriptional regulator [Trueperaceae bacterium]|nr:MAG: MerR family transcriptional regulator [Trueperaceae bacterium]
METRRTYHVSDVARIAGVSVRTLHHYDEIGLLVPHARTEAGYRVYGDHDLLRLQQILIGRERGLSLEGIRRSLDDPGFDHRQALLAHRRQLQVNARRTHAMIRAVDTALAILDGGEGDTMDMQELFDGFDPTQHEAEAQERWGDTDAYRESAKRTKRYGQAEWSQIRDEHAAIYADAVAVLQAGSAPDADEAMAIAERHRQSIGRWFYPCSPTMHAGLADMWEADQRFADNLDRFGAGLTAFLAAAVRANARRSAA